jgi:hypothetical protein
MNTCLGKSTPRRQAFTIVEMLVSTSILTLLVVFINQMVNSAAKTTSSSGKHIDSDNQARLIFAKMGADFAAILNRTDVDYYFHNQAGNDEFYFYSQSPGHFAIAGPVAADINTTSLIGYRVNSSAQMERLGRGLVWTATSAQDISEGQANSVLFLPYGGIAATDSRLIKNAFSQAISDPYNNSSNPNPDALSSGVPEWDVIGDQVFRMEFCFLLTNGTFSQIPMVSGSVPIQTRPPGANDDSTAGCVAGSRWYDSTAQVAYVCTNSTKGSALWAYLGLQDVKAIVVTLGLLDTPSRATTSMTAIQKTITVGAFPDFSTASPTPLASAWTQSANNVPNLVSTTGLSYAAASAIRIYERIFYLN